MRLLTTSTVILFTGFFSISLALPPPPPPRNKTLKLKESSSKLHQFILLSNNSDDTHTLQFKSQLDAISEIIASQTQEILHKNFNSSIKRNNTGNLNLNVGTEKNYNKNGDDDDNDEEMKPGSNKIDVEPQFFNQNGTLLILCGRKFNSLNRTGKIIGGKNASFASHPWQISLMIWKKTKFYHSCGAVLLNENWAVTAAHCLKHVRPTDVLLRLGEYDFSESDISDSNKIMHFVERRVRIISRHPKFDPEAWNFKYDLALLKFSKPVDFAQNIIPICLPSNDDKLAGKEAVVTGWGRTDKNANTKYFLSLPSKLQEVSVPIVTNPECNAMYVKAGFFDEKFPDLFICAGLEMGSKDACDGDSGGPMSLKGPNNRWFLAGIVSFGIGCGEPNKPGLYTRISVFRHWIDKIIAY